MDINNSIIKTKTEYTKSVRTLRKWSKYYYMLDNPIASDYEYDILYKAVEEYEENNPDKVNRNSPTQYVGYKWSNKKG